MSAKLDDTAPAAELDSSSSSSCDSSDSEKDEDEFDEDVEKLNSLMGDVSISVTTNEHCYFKIHA